ncbi:MAG: biotin transporter BioY [Chlamydiales bacterium]|nr:biotin transporter BioY [Chlamydiales bacterium]
MASTLYAKAQNVAVLKNELVQVLIGVGLLACSAQISIPLQPVPITMQSAAVLLIGLFYSQSAAVKTLIAYLTLGALGAPVFANFSGSFAHFLQPTAGFLFGFIACVAIMTAFRDKIGRETFLTQVSACALGSLAMYACGISWLALFVGVPKAFYYGFVPFIIPGIIKGFIVAYASKHCKSSKWI